MLLGSTASKRDRGPAANCWGGVWGRPNLHAICGRGQVRANDPFGQTRAFRIVHPQVAFEEEPLSLWKWEEGGGGGEGGIIMPLLCSVTQDVHHGVLQPGRATRCGGPSCLHSATPRRSSWAGALLAHSLPLRALRKRPHREPPTDCFTQNHRTRASRGQLGMCLAAQRGQACRRLGLGLPSIRAGM